MDAESGSLAIVPAAGASRRMGRPKLLLPWGGRTVIGSLVAALREGGAARVLLVVAPANEELAAWGRERDVEVAVNHSPEGGMLSTIRAGLAAAGGATALSTAQRPVLIAPGDLPALSPLTVRSVLAALAAGAPLAVPLRQGRRGHPLGIAPHLLREIDHLDPAIGLRHLLLLHPSDLVEVPVDDPGAVADLDTPEDYARLAPPSSGD